MATSASGSGLSEQGVIEPLDISVSMCIDVIENPKTQAKLETPENAEAAPIQPAARMTQIKFSTSRDKFL